MLQFTRAGLIVALLLVAPLPAAEEQFAWQSAKPADQGMSAERLDRLREDLAKRGTKTFLVVRHDKIVYEWYADDWNAEKPHYTASMAKAIVGGMSLAAAMQEGRIKPDDLASKYVPQWKQDPRKSKITVWQLATHTSGLDDAHDPDL